MLCWHREVTGGPEAGTHFMRERERYDGVYTIGGKLLKYMMSLFVRGGGGWVEV